MSECHVGLGGYKVRKSQLSWAQTNWEAIPQHGAGAWRQRVAGGHLVATEVCSVSRSVCTVSLRALESRDRGPTGRPVWEQVPGPYLGCARKRAQQGRWWPRAPEGNSRRGLLGGSCCRAGSNHRLYPAACAVEQLLGGPAQCCLAAHQGSMLERAAPGRCCAFSVTFSSAGSCAVVLSRCALC